MTSLGPRVYVACLACYNSGKLHGEWFDANDDLPGNVAEYFGTDAESESICPACGDDLDGDGMHVGGVDCGQDPEPSPRCKVSGGEEFLVHDYEGFGALKIGECSYETAAAVGQWIRDLDDWAAELTTALHVHRWGAADLDAHHLERSAEEFDGHYSGEHASLADWAADLHSEAVPDSIKINDIPASSYIDWERVARDAELGGDVFTIELDGKVHVFWNR
jgi:antirestriction protein